MIGPLQIVLILPFLLQEHVQTQTLNKTPNKEWWQLIDEIHKFCDGKNFLENFVISSILPSTTTFLVGIVIIRTTKHQNYSHKFSCV
jgi:hypothetical protein